MSNSLDLRPKIIVFHYRCHRLILPQQNKCWQCLSIETPDFFYRPQFTVSMLYFGTNNDLEYDLWIGETEKNVKCPKNNNQSPGLLEFDMKLKACSMYVPRFTSIVPIFLCSIVIHSLGMINHYFDSLPHFHTFERRILSLDTSALASFTQFSVRFICAQLHFKRFLCLFPKWTALNLELNELLMKSGQKVNSSLLMEVHKIYKFTWQLQRRTTFCCIFFLNLNILQWMKISRELRLFKISAQR